MRKLLPVIFLTVLASVSVTAQTQTREADRARRRFWMSMSVTGVFDTNITHDEQQISAFGIVPGFGLHFRDNAERPSFEADYEVALHRYNNTDEFDRVSHSVTTVYRRQLAKQLYSKTSTEISLKGSSEDREVNNNYVVEQQLQYRFPSNTRVAGLAAYRLKRYPFSDRDSNAIDSYAGAKIEQRLRGDRRVEFTYRYDHNRAWNSRNSYFRRKYSLEFQTPLSVKRADSLSAEFRYSPRTYQTRLTRVNGVRVPRHDDRWNFNVTYERLINSSLLMAFEYEFEKRNSNDSDKRFSVNVFALTFTFDGWGLR
jgi:hypothetical protein